MKTSTPDFGEFPEFDDFPLIDGSRAAPSIKRRHATLGDRVQGALKRLLQSPAIAMLLGALMAIGMVAVLVKFATSTAPVDSASESAAHLTAAEAPALRVGRLDIGPISGAAAAAESETTDRGMPIHMFPAAVEPTVAPAAEPVAAPVNDTCAELRRTPIFQSLTDTFSKGFEPSGCVYSAALGQFVVVSDNGKMAAVGSDGVVSARWRLGKRIDAEAVTVVPPMNHSVFVAVERPSGIIEFDVAAGAPVRRWNLTAAVEALGAPDGGNRGVEGLVYLPSTKPTPLGAPGYFFVGLQGSGRVLVLDLDLSAPVSGVAPRGRAVGVIGALPGAPSDGDLAELAWDGRSSVYFVYDAPQLALRVTMASLLNATASLEASLASQLAKRALPVVNATLAGASEAGNATAASLGEADVTVDDVVKTGNETDAGATVTGNSTTAEATVTDDEAVRSGNQTAGESATAVNETLVSTDAVPLNETATDTLEISANETAMVTDTVEQSGNDTTILANATASTTNETAVPTNTSAAVTTEASPTSNVTAPTAPTPSLTLESAEESAVESIMMRVKAAASNIVVLSAKDITGRTVLPRVGYEGLCFNTTISTGGALGNASVPEDAPTQVLLALDAKGKNNVDLERVEGADWVSCVVSV